jgi:hypothetical protein
MAIRTTEAAVESIIEVDILIPLTPFIETANNLVDQVCLASGYSDATLELIERWLSAHFYATRDPRTSQEAVKGIMEEFEGTTKIGLNNTRYGQQALLLDTKGNLALIVADNSGQLFIRDHIQIAHIGGPSADVGY